MTCLAERWQTVRWLVRRRRRVWCTAALHRPGPRLAARVVLVTIYPTLCLVEGLHLLEHCVRITMYLFTAVFPSHTKESIMLRLVARVSSVTMSCIYLAFAQL